MPTHDLSSFADRRSVCVSLALALPLLLTGCPTATERPADDTGTRDAGTSDAFVPSIDAALPDAFARDAAIGIDAFVPDAFVRDASRVDAGPRCGDGICGVDETALTCDDDCGSSGETRAYVVSILDSGEGATDFEFAFGFDLDGMVDGTAGLPCTAAPDFTSSVTGDVGVDNQFSTIFPTLGTMLPGGIDGAFQEQIQSGALLLVVEVSRIDSFTSDPFVIVHLARATLPSSATIVLDGPGLAAGQTFVETTDLGVFVGSITAGRLGARSDATVPISFGFGPALAVRNLVLGARLSDTGGLTEGELGGLVSVDDLVTSIMTVIDGVDRATIEALTQPDVDPDSTGEHCDSISLGLGVQAVRAILE